MQYIFFDSCSLRTSFYRVDYGSKSSKVNQQYVSTFLTAGNIKFLLLHAGKNEDTIKNFFYDVHELYVRQLMNPFYRHDTPILNNEFDKRVKNISRKYFW